MSDFTPIGDDRPPCYYEGETLIIRASAIGSTCLWELVASAQGYEQSAVPDTLQAAFDEGHRLEPVINEMLRAEGYEITGSQDEGHLVISPTLKIRYHPDGYIKHATDSGMPKILEDKTMSNDSWQRAARGSVGDIFAEYNWQISVMMWANAEQTFLKDIPLAPMPALWVAYNKGNADGSECLDAGRLLFEPIDRPPISLVDITVKAQLIQELVQGEDILVSGRPCDDPSHYPCRFLHLRPQSEEPITTIDGNYEIPEDEREEVDHLVMEYVRFKAAHEEAKSKMDAAKEAIIARAKAAGEVKRLITDQWIVPIVNGSNTTPDWANMPQEIRDEAKKYVKTSRYKYLKNIQRRG